MYRLHQNQTTIIIHLTVDGQNYAVLNIVIILRVRNSFLYVCTSNRKKLYSTCEQINASSLLATTIDCTNKYMDNNLIWIQHHAKKTNLHFNSINYAPEIYKLSSVLINTIRKQITKQNMYISRHAVDDGFLNTNASTFNLALCINSSY